MAFKSFYWFSKVFKNILVFTVNSRWLVLAYFDVHSILKSRNSRPMIYFFSLYDHSPRWEKVLALLIVVLVVANELIIGKLRVSLEWAMSLFRKSLFLECSAAVSVFWPLTTIKCDVMPRVEQARVGAVIPS